MAKKTQPYEDEWPGRDSWSAGSVWLGYTMFYGFMPLWLGVIAGLGFSNQRVRWTDFLIHGELLIYAASLTAYSTRLIASDVPTTLQPYFPCHNHPVSRCVRYCYGAYVFASHWPDQGFIYDLVFRAHGPIQYFFSLVVFVEDHRRTTNPLNVAAEYKKEEDQLSVDFDKTEGPEALPPQGETQPSRGDEHE
jgi:hypothetical protein